MFAEFDFSIHCQMDIYISLYRQASEEFFQQIQYLHFLVLQLIMQTHGQFPMSLKILFLEFILTYVNKSIILCSQHLNIQVIIQMFKSLMPYGTKKSPSNNLIYNVMFLTNFLLTKHLMMYIMDFYQFVIIHITLTFKFHLLSLIILFIKSAVYSGNASGYNSSTLSKETYFS